MSNEQIKQFGDLDYIPVGDIEDAKNKIPTSWKWLTPSQKDVGITPSQLQQITVLDCDSPAASDKTGTYKDGLDLSGTPEQCTGRSVLVHFVNANEKEDVSFTYKNCTGLIKSFNEKTTPVHDSINADSWCLLTWNGTEWLMQPKADFRKINEIITVINSKIPAAASAENQLTDKKYVDDSIATNSAHFLGTYDSVDKIKGIKNPTNNDYAHYEYTDSDGTKFFDRYKYSDVADSEGNHWKKEFTFESTDFNQAQMNAINSGIDKNFVDHAKEITPSEATAENKLADKKFVNDAGVALQENIDKKVDKQEGKGLSTNDFTDELKANVEDNTSKAHTHDNKNVLDILGQTEDGQLKFGDTTVGKVQGVKGDAETEYRTGEVNITKDNIGLGNVDNTSDADKPVSTATQTELDKKADKENPVMTGSFSLNRVNGIKIGTNSFAAGDRVIAKGEASHAEGFYSSAIGTGSHAEGINSSSEGEASHAEGELTSALKSGAHSEGIIAEAHGEASHAEGYNTRALGHYSHAEGYNTKASANNSHAQGRNNVEDTEKKFADIIGNGESSSKAHNASATDWDGNQYLAGDLYVRGTNDDATGGEKVATVTEVGTVQTAVDTLNGNDTVEGSVDYKITEALRGITTFDFKIVSVLPEEGKKGIIYLVRNTSTDEEDKYDEYIWIETETEKYYEMLGSKVVKVDLTEYQKVDGSNATAAGVSAAINKLSTGSSDPEDNDYFISQYVNGGTTATTYHRRPMSKLWNYIKGKIGSNSNEISNKVVGGMNLVTSEISDDTEFAFHYVSPSDANGGVYSRKATFIWNYVKSKTDTVYAAKSHTHDYLPISGGSIKGKLVVNPSYNSTSNSYNEGVRINLADNGWANVVVGGTVDSTANPTDGLWLVGRRGAVGTKSGGIGDFTIEHNGSQGNGLTLYKNGNVPTWNGRNLAYEDDTRSLLNQFDRSEIVCSTSVTYDIATRTLSTTKTNNTWDGQAYSTKGYTKCRLEFKAIAAAGHKMIGINTDPTTDANYTSIDYCWYLHANGSINFHESGSDVAGISGHTTYTANDSFVIDYDGTTIRYYHNGVLCRSVTNAGKTFYFDSSFYNAGGIYDLAFNGTLLNYLPKTGKAASANITDKIATYKADGSGTYGSNYPLYAKWNTVGNEVKLTCDGYTTVVDSATAATNLKVTNHDTNNTTYYPVWVSAIGNGSAARATYTSTDLNYIPATGEFKSKKFTVDKNVSLQWNSTTKSLDFVFA